MPDQQIQRSVCRSVFKSSQNIRKKQFTEKWIKLIDRMEKSKRMTAQRRGQCV